MIKLTDRLNLDCLKFVGDLVKRYEDRYDYSLWCSDSKLFYNKIVLEDMQLMDKSLEIFTLKELLINIKDKYKSTLESTSLFIGYELELNSELAIINTILQNWGTVENLLA